MSSHQRYMREDNHFVRWPLPSGWILIDGPWYELLQKWTDGKYINYHVPTPLELNFSAGWNGGYPTFTKLEFVEWESVMWHPGSIDIRQFINSHNYYTVNRYISDRKRIGYRVVPNGVIPFDVNRIIAPQDEL